jgi:GH15 family glucan-1,4-alpha-glucosidase
MSSGYPRSYDVADCVLLQATSTNCLYVLGMRVMAGMAQALGQEAEATAWLSRARQLTEAIGAHLRGPDGKLMYYRDRNGELSDRREALGLGLAVLAGVVQGADAAAQVDYPVTTAGAPLIWPFYEDDRMYHNNSSWPFVDAFLLWGAEEATGRDRKAQAAALLGRTTAIDGSFHELVDMRDGSIGGSGKQLWSAAGFVNVCLRAGLVEQIHRDV